MYIYILYIYIYIKGVLILLQYSQVLSTVVKHPSQTNLCGCIKAFAFKTEINSDN